MLTIALIITGSVIGYMTGCGVMYGLGKARNWDFEDPGPTFALILWPLALPAVASARITQSLIDRSRQRKALPEAKVVRR